MGRACGRASRRGACVNRRSLPPIPSEARQPNRSKAATRPGMATRILHCYSEQAAPVNFAWRFRLDSPLSLRMLAPHRSQVYGATISLVRVIRMKTTIELPDELLEQVRRVARREGASLRRLVEEGLQRSLEARRKAARRDLDFPSYGGGGLTSEFQGAPWSRLRNEIYRERGA